MTDLKDIGTVLLVFFLLVPVFAIFYTNFLSSNSITPASLQQYNGSQYITSITKTAINMTQSTEQPSGTGLDFFFGLPALLLQTGGEIVSLLYKAPFFISDAFNSLEIAFPGYYIGTLGNIIAAIVTATVMFLIVYFLRGYRA